MKRVLLVSFLLVMFASLALSGTPVTKAGTHGLWFKMNGLGDFGVTGVAPYTFGGHYFIQDDMALRLGLGFNLSTSSDDGPPKYETTDMLFGVYPALLWYCVSSGPVSGYWGPMVAFQTQTYEEKVDGTTVTGSKASYTAWGVGFVVGAHYWAMDMLSFNAEYSLSYLSSSGEIGGSDTPTFNDIGINSWGVGLNWWFDR